MDSSIAYRTQRFPSNLDYAARSCNFLPLFFRCRVGLNQVLLMFQHQQRGDFEMYSRYADKYGTSDRVAVEISPAPSNGLVCHAPFCDHVPMLPPVFRAARRRCSI